MVGWIVHRMAEIERESRSWPAWMLEVYVARKPKTGRDGYVRGHPRVVTLCERCPKSGCHVAPFLPNEHPPPTQTCFCECHGVGVTMEQSAGFLALLRLLS